MSLCKAINLEQLGMVWIRDDIKSIDKEKLIP